MPFFFLEKQNKTAKQVLSQGELSVGGKEGHKERV
jgi:hypothetical protein